MPVDLGGDRINVRAPDGTGSAFRLISDGEGLRLHVPAGSAEQWLPALCAAIEMLTAGERTVRLALDCDDGALRHA